MTVTDCLLPASPRKRPPAPPFSWLTSERGGIRAGQLPRRAFRPHGGDVLRLWEGELEGHTRQTGPLFREPGTKPVQAIVAPSSCAHPVHPLIVSGSPSEPAGPRPGAGSFHLSSAPHARFLTVVPRQVLLGHREDAGHQ